MDAPSTAEMLAWLVSFDTTSRNSNLPLIDHVRAYLDAHGIQDAGIPTIICGPGHI